MIRLCIFASGSGTNAENIAKYFKNNSLIEVSAIFYNKPNAGVVDRMDGLNIPCHYFDNKAFANSDFLSKLEELQIDFVILAGFLRKLSASFTEKFHNRILNIHPALLPNYGGKGMYGMHVHRAVKQAGDSHTGISIHLVNENYDEGNMVFQAQVALDASDTPESIAQKVHVLEYEHFPKVIENYISKYGEEN